MAVTIRDIARAAKVTAGTVSRALNGYPDVSPATRQRIADAARALGYAPNKMASSLSSKRKKSMGLVLSGFLEEDMINSFGTMLMRGCYRFAMEQDVELSIHVINSRIQAETGFEQLCHRHSIAGAILFGLKTTDPYCRTLAQSAVPCVTVDIEVKGPCVGCVTVDDVAAFDEMTQYLIGLGHRRIAVIQGRREAMVSMLRLCGAHQAMERSGLSLRGEDVIDTNYLPQEAARGVERYLQAHPPGRGCATAFLCMSDMLAVGAVEGLKAAGLRIPEDCSVVGYDGLPFTDHTDPPITTVDQDIQQKGYEAARLLWDMIGGVRPAQRLVLPHSIDRKGSAGPPAPQFLP